MVRTLAVVANPLMLDAAWLQAAASRGTADTCFIRDSAAAK